MSTYARHDVGIPAGTGMPVMPMQFVRVCYCCPRLSSHEQAEEDLFCILAPLAEEAGLCKATPGECQTLYCRCLYPSPAPSFPYDILPASLNPDPEP